MKVKIETVAVEAKGYVVVVRSCDDTRITFDMYVGKYDVDSTFRAIKSAFHDIYDLPGMVVDTSDLGENGKAISRFISANSRIDTGELFSHIPAARDGNLMRGCDSKVPPVELIPAFVHWNTGLTVATIDWDSERNR